MTPKTAKWPALREGLREFSAAAMKVFQDCVGNGTAIPVHSETVPVRSGKNQWSFETKDFPLFAFLFVKCDKNLKALAEYQLCESLFMKERAIAVHMNQLVGTAHQSTFLSGERVLHAMLLDQLNDGSLDFRVDKFDQTYEKVEEYFSSQTERFVGWVPLKNFSSELDEINVDPGIAVRRLPDEVIAEFFGYGGSGSFGGTNEVLQWTHGICVEYELPKIFGGIVGAADKSLEPLRANFDRPVDDVIRSLRLIKSGVVGIGPKLMKPQTWSPETGTLLYYGFPDVPFRAPYVLVQGDVTALLSLLPAVKVLDRERFSFLELALRRFNQSYGRVGAEDRLIDYMIAFEALYLNDTGAQERGEMRFRLALRVAKFLREPNQQQSLYREMRAAYNMRSSIGHGDVYDPPKVDGRVIPIEEFISRIENYLRESLIKFLKLAQEPNPKHKLVSWEDLLFREA